MELQAEETKRNGAAETVSAEREDLKLKVSAEAASASAQDDAHAKFTLDVGEEPRDQPASPSQPSANAGEQSSPSGQPASGVIDIADYELVSMIGKGGMGTVYRAKHKELGTEFAVKMVHSEKVADSSALEKFEQEAKAATNLTHANLVAVYGHGKTEEGTPYLVMDLVEGTSLAETIAKEGFVEPSRAVDIFIQVCDGLIHAHMKGVIHRDLKPSNIILTKDENGAEMAKVFDFGIAKMLSSDTTGGGAKVKTATAQVFGTPFYMSPEQSLGLKVDERADVYSLGCVMYEVLTGRPPFKGENPVQVLMKHVNEKPASFKKKFHDLGIPEGLEIIVMSALAKMPQRRYQSVEQLRQELLRFKEGRQVRKRWHPPTKKDLKKAWPWLGAVCSLWLMFFVYSVLVNNVAHQQDRPFTPGARNEAPQPPAGPTWRNEDVSEIRSVDGNVLFKCPKPTSMSDALQMAVDHHTNLARADLSGWCLEDVSLRNAHMSQANLSGAKLDRVKMSGGDISGATLHGASVTSCVFSETRGVNCSFNDTDSHSADNSFERVNFNHTDFGGSTLVGSKFKGGDLRNCYFGHCVLTNSEFNKADCTDTNFEATDLSSVNVLKSRGMSSSRGG
jgi:serine/threonine protein kinase